MLHGETIISGEVTTSREPKGVIDSRMASTLKKVAAMEGKRFYFVLTAAMANRARTPRANGKWNTCLGQFRVQVGHAHDLIV
jgi:hypothetical protein